MSEKSRFTVRRPDCDDFGVYMVGDEGDTRARTRRLDATKAFHVIDTLVHTTKECRAECNHDRLS